MNQSTEKKNIAKLIKLIENCQESAFDFFLEKLRTKPSPFAVYYNLTKDEWKNLARAFTGFPSYGPIIYYQLHDSTGISS